MKKYYVREMDLFDTNEFHSGKGDVAVIKLSEIITLIKIRIDDTLKHREGCIIFVKNKAHTIPNVRTHYCRECALGSIKQLEQLIKQLEGL